MPPLAWKAGAVLALMIIVGVLTVVARRRNFDGVRRLHTTRKDRVAANRLDAPGGEVVPKDREPR
jgi:hypothetical protein